jgi:hypothetical protein
MSGDLAAVAAVILAVALLGAAAMILRAARVHSAAVDRQRQPRPVPPGQFPGQGPEYQQARPELPRRRRRRGRLLAPVLAGIALYCYAGPAAVARASKLVHGHAGPGPSAVAVIAVIAVAALAGWSLSRRFARSRRYTRRPGW